MPALEAVTGLVLAGGRGLRMGGVDKGLARFVEGTLVSNAIDRLSPQVADIVISANRHHDVYGALGFRVCGDSEHHRFEGPLAGFLAGLEACSANPWLATVPCDTPGFPLDVVDRLRKAVLSSGTRLAVVSTSATGANGEQMLEPAFCLVHRSLAESLQAFLTRGERKVERWIRSQRFAMAYYEDTAPFANANTLEQLAALEKTSGAESFAPRGDV